MRTLLNGLYRASGIVAGLFLVAICVVVVLQVVGNLIDRVLVWTMGEPIGIIIPSYADFAGFFLAASTFLALAYTLRIGGHIRVKLLIQRSSSRVRRLFELWCLGSSGLLSAYFTYYTILLVAESLEYGDLSSGMVPVPLWIPQAAMTLGLGVLTIAFVDEFCGVAAGQQPSYEAEDGEAQHEPHRTE